MSNARYSGRLTYSGLASATLVERFELIDSTTVLLELVNPHDAADGTETRFLGVAEKRADGVFQSPWIYLTTLDGEDLPEQTVTQLSLSILEIGAEEIKVEGEWTDYEVATYAFQGRLTRGTRSNGRPASETDA